MSAAVYAARYISDRFLPDKAIDLVDEAASSLRLAQESKPDALEQLDRAAMTMQIELASLRNESDPLSADRREALEQALDRTRKEAEALEEQWQAGSSCLLPSCPRAFIHLMCDQSASGYSAIRNESAALRKPNINWRLHNARVTMRLRHVCAMPRSPSSRARFPRRARARTPCSASA